MYAGHGAEVTNSNDIIVNKGVGLLIEGIGDGNAAAKGANEREITVNGPDSIGVKVLSLAEFENNGNITVSGGGLGVQSDSDWENAGSFIVSGDDSVAVNVLKINSKILALLRLIQPERMLYIIRAAWLPMTGK